ncbi:hypothetical protein [Planomicrobium sp. MB-3u-38]|uniref:hypothetical protein n=1 Tax=Planomicrobium sp. MB-3u-38 TaxID=2058318 RepID=UPI001304622D|nr:hypothetical protein [Planomicrobium sp. MB-3u-38]
MGKYVSAITILSILLLLLVTTNQITLEVFFLIFAPLSIVMLAIGVIEFKNTVQNK